MKRACTLMAAACLATITLARGDAGDAKKDLDAMQGTWRIESIQESFGKAPPEDSVKEFVVTVKHDVMKITHKGAAGPVFKLKLDPAKTPKTIDFTHSEGPDKGKTEPGIYKIDGDTLTYCVTDIGKERPTVFATKEGTKNSLFVLKRVK
jgi:uncharacterized protein (TIGR03067 family)